MSRSRTCASVSAGAGRARAGRFGAARATAPAATPASATIDTMILVIERETSVGRREIGERRGDPRRIERHVVGGQCRLSLRTLGIQAKRIAEDGEQGQV